MVVVVVHVGISNIWKSYDSNKLTRQQKWVFNGVINHRRNYRCSNSRHVSAVEAGARCKYCTDQEYRTQCNFKFRFHIKLPQVQNNFYFKRGNFSKMKGLVRRKLIGKIKSQS